MLPKRKQPESKQKIATDFKGRAVFAQYSPIGYESYKPFIDEFKSVLDSYLDKLFAAGTALDEGNKDVLDKLITDMAAKAEQHLEQQRIEHKKEIRSLANRRSGDRRAFEQQHKTLTEALAQNTQELDEIQRRCQVSKF